MFAQFTVPVSLRYSEDVSWSEIDRDADDVMDELLNIELLECDPLTHREKETPIHCAVKYANEREVELGEAMAKMLIDAGGDPRVKDRHGRKPAEICTGRTAELRSVLTKEEYILNEGLNIRPPALAGPALPGRFPN
jgi:DNA-directed RNA polymerase subunit F